MKNRLRALFLMLALTALLAVSAAAAGDPVEQMAEEMERFESCITVPVRDYDALMEQTFTRYPQLYFYFDGASYRSVAEGLEIYISYCNTDKSLEDVYVVHSKEQLMAAMGLAMSRLSPGVDIVSAPDYEMQDSDLQEVWDSLSEDYYMIYMGYHSYTSNWNRYSVGDASVGRYAVNLGFWDGIAAEDVRRWRDVTEETVTGLASTLFAQDMPDYMKELLIHDYLVDNNYYDSLHIDDAVNHVAYSALAEGKTVCQGYAAAANLLFRAAGVPSLYVMGDAGGSHSWNCVQIGGQWYMLDITWDDPTDENGGDPGIKSYNYFNVTSAQLSRDHTWEAGDYPDCTAVDMSYDAVAAAVTADGGVYSDFSTELVETQAEDEAAFMAILGLSAGPEQDSQPAAVTEPEDVPGDEESPEEPEIESPGNDLEPEASDVPGEEETDGLLEKLKPVALPSAVENILTEQESSGGVSVLSVLIFLIIGAAAIWLLLYGTMSRRVYSARAERRRYRDRAAAMSAAKRRSLAGRR